MSKTHFAACICRRNLQKLLHDSRLFLCVAAVAVLLICRYTQELRDFCGQLQANVSPLPVFVALTNRLYLYRLLLFLFLMLICDAPFVDRGMPYLILRSNRKSWFWGTFFTLAALALFFWGMVFAVCVLSVAGCCEWTADWGRVFLSLMKTDELMYFGSEISFFRALGNALEAFGWSFLLKLLVSLLLGALTWAINLKSRKNVGVIFAVLLVLFNEWIFSWFVDRWMVYFSPVSWGSLGCLNLENSPVKIPSLSYAVCALTGALAFLLLLAWRFSLCGAVEVRTLNT